MAENQQSQVNLRLCKLEISQRSFDQYDDLLLDHSNDFLDIIITKYETIFSNLSLKPLFINEALPQKFLFSD